MIPLKLELTNFLSYRERAILDFDGLHLACIAGMNGAGKSSILDGMTWALFGQARGRSDDDLVNRRAAHQGEQAEVRFDFELNGVIYRIIRQKKARKATVLEFQIASDYESEAWKTLSRAKRKETEEAIEEVLGMNFDTFINASFLLQGKADEFTTKTPNRRKEVLADLLGVSVWNRYRDAFAEKRRMVQNQLSIIEAELSTIHLELLEEPTRQEAHKVAVSEQKEIQTRLEIQEERLQTAKRTADLIEQQRKTVERLTQSVGQMTRRLDEWNRRAANQRAELEQADALLTRSEEIKTQYQHWITLRDEAAVFQQQADQHNRLKETLNPLNIQLAQEASRLETEKRNLEKRRVEISEQKLEAEALHQRASALDRQLATLNNEINALGAAEAAYETVNQTLQATRSEKNLLEQELGQLKKTEERMMAQKKQLLNNQTLLKEKEAALRTADEALVTLQAEQVSLTQLKQEEAGLKAENRLLKEEMITLRGKMDALESERGGPCPHCNQPLTDAHVDEVVRHMESQGLARKETYTHNRTRLPQVTQEIEHLEKRQAGRQSHERTLQQLNSQIGSLRSQVDRAAETLGEWETEGSTRLTQLRPHLDKLTADLTTQFAELEVKRAAWERLRQLTKERDRLNSEQSNLKVTLSQIEIARTEWETVGMPSLRQIETLLTEKSYLPEVQSEAAELEKEISALAYDALAHTNIRQKRDAVADVETRYHQLEKAATQAETLTRSIETLTGEIGEQHRLIEQQSTDRDQAQALLSQLEHDSGSGLTAIEAETRRLREQNIAANQKVAQTEARLVILDTQRQRKKEKEAERDGINLNIQRLKMLEKGCGRDGVQALLIEKALPDIEETTNHLLERLTDGRMRVEFDTQKELKSKKGELAETLDIRISDDSGVRPYENYSGGEQFRVNFAIRIALSQILARRAGIQLQTLVIDEGFGSQDPIGRARLIEAIRTIEDDFKRILIITHIDELRDAFPNKIEVIKTPQGSQIEVT